MNKGIDSSIILVALSSVAYLLFADLFRAQISGFTTEDRLVLLGIVAIVTVVFLNFEGDSE